jgi:hypothetical protein
MPPSCFVAGGTFYGNPNKYINLKFGFLVLNKISAEIVSL